MQGTVLNQRRCLSAGGQLLQQLCKVFGRMRVAAAAAASDAEVTRSFH
jgi:hypothetical protein